MTKKVSKEALEKEYEEAKAKLAGASGGRFKFVEGLPDGPGKKMRIPFPYGSSKPRPYGWYLN